LVRHTVPSIMVRSKRIPFADTTITDSVALAIQYILPRYVRKEKRAAIIN